MRVLHVEAGTHLYGGARQVLYLLAGLRQRGVENLLACPRGSEIARRASGEAEVIALPMRGDIDLALVPRLRRVIGDRRPDLVHLHSRRGADVLGGLAARSVGVPSILSRRVDNPEPRLWVAMKYRLFAHVITISEGIRAVLLREGLPADKVTCVHSAVDETVWQHGCDRSVFLREFGLQADTPLVGMVAQFIPRKGHRHLLASLPEVLKRFPDLQVLFFGQGPLLAEVRAAVEAQDLAARVLFAGFRHDLERWIGCLDLLLHPAEREGLGVSLLQAAAAGVPIVASRAGGIPEIVEHRRNGLLITPGDSAALTDAMIELLGDAELRAAMGRRGREMVGERFALPVMVDGNLAVYRRVLGLGGVQRSAVAQ